MSAQKKPNGTAEILVVEDSPTQAEQLRYLLEQHHYTVTAAQDGKQALALMEEHKPTLVISDIVMPEMNGYELCQRIKANERTQDIPVILLTSLSDPADVLEGLACGADNFITKPYGEDYLLSHIEQVLANQKLRKGERVRVGVEILFAGKRRFITADQQQMLTLLISTYEAAVHRNAELIQAQGELRSLNEHLEDLVEARTAALSAEIVERKQAEDKLAASEAELRALFAAMTDVVIVYDADGRYIKIAPTYPTNLYRPPGDMLGKTVHDILPKEQADYIVAKIGGAIQTGQVVTGEYALQIGGKEVWFSATASPLTANTAVWVAHDITNRKRAEAQLLKLRKAVDTSGEAIFMADRNGLITFVNPEFTWLYGYSAEEVVGKTTPRILKSGRMKPEDYALFWQAIINGQAVRGEMVNKTKDGRLLTIETSVSSVLDEEQNIAGFLAIQRDITGRKQAEETLRLRLVELEAVHTVSAALRAAQTRDEALPILLEETLAALETGAGVLWLYHAGSDDLRVAIARGWFRGLSDPPMKPGEGIGGTVFAGGQAHISAEFARDPLARQPAAGQIPDGWGGACVPIPAGAVTIGVLFVAVPLPRQITTEQMRLLESLAEMAGAALHRMRLHDETVRQLDQLQALRNIDLAIIGSTDLSMTLNVLLEHVLTQLKVDAASILLLNPLQSTLEYAAGRGFRTDAPQHTHLRLGEGYVGRAVLERKLIYIPDLRGRKTDFLRSPYFSAEGFVAYYAVPLIAKGQVVGVLEAFHRAPLAAGPDWIGFLETLAGQAAIAIDNAQLFDGLQRANADLTAAYDATLEGWSRALDLRDQETEGHTRRVTEMTLRLARALGMSDEDLGHIRRGALLHDIGKMGIPDAILLKPGPLTDDEWVIMRKHPTCAYELLSPIAYLQLSLDIPYCHHEKWDGSGYPRGLKGEQIPLAARLFAIVDVWDALRSDRPYRAAWPEEKVREYIREQAGKHFDPAVAEVFLRELIQ